MYEIVEKFISKPYIAGIISAITCPVINTGVFLLGCVTFFIKTVTEWAGGTNVGKYLILGLVGGNFLIEMAVIIIFAPAIVRIIKVVTNK